MAASNSSSVFSYTSSQIPAFNGEHYDYRSSQMEKIFLLQELWDVVEEDYEERPQPKAATWTDNKEKEYKKNVKKNATIKNYPTRSEQSHLSRNLWHKKSQRGKGNTEDKILRINKGDCYQAAVFVGRI